MYFVLLGNLQYIGEDEEANIIVPGNWTSEGTLWTKWTHRGFLTATDNCRLSYLDAESFHEIVTTFEHPPNCDPSLYAAHFVNTLNEMEEDEITDIFHTTM